jgi:hypothetical protein
LGKIKQTGGDKSGEYGGVMKGCNIFEVKNWQTLAALWTGALLCNEKKSRKQNPFSESEELQTWGCSKIFISFLMRFDRYFLLNQWQQQ